MESFIFEQQLLFRVDFIPMTLGLGVQIPRVGLERSKCRISLEFDFFFFYGIIHV